MELSDLTPYQRAQFRAAVGSAALIRLAALITWVLAKQPNIPGRSEEVMQPVLERFPQLALEYAAVEEAYKGGMPAMVVFAYASQAVLEQVLPVMLELSKDDVVQ